MDASGRPNHRADGPDLIIVAGVSGSGKTAFLSQLKSGRLPDGLVLPVGAADWPIVQIEPGKRVCIQKLRRSITSRQSLPRRAQGVILHYDLKGWGEGHSDFENDPALALVSLARAVTVINLRVSRDRIIRQLTDRETKKSAKYEREQGRLMWQLALPALKVADHILPKSFARVIRRHTPYRKSRFLERLEVKIRAYALPGRLEEIHSRWAAYLSSIEKAGKPMKQIFVEPEAEPFSWRTTAERSFEST